MGRTELSTEFSRITSCHRQTKKIAEVLQCRNWDTDGSLDDRECGQNVVENKVWQFNRECTTLKALIEKIESCVPRISYWKWTRKGMRSTTGSTTAIYNVVVDQCFKANLHECAPVSISTPWTTLVTKSVHRGNHSGCRIFTSLPALPALPAHIFNHFLRGQLITVQADSCLTGCLKCVVRSKRVFLADVPSFSGWESGKILCLFFCTSRTGRILVYKVHKSKQLLNPAGRQSVNHAWLFLMIFHFLTCFQQNSSGIIWLKKLRVAKIYRCRNHAWRQVVIPRLSSIR